MSRVVLFLVLLGLAGPSHAQQKDSPDLQAYVDGIRASGISELGRSDVMMIAGICAGATILDYHKDEATGRYWPSYMSATCPKPGADPPQIEQWKKLRRSDAEVLADKLKPFADADGSGFVTTKEASDFRALVEFGYLLNQVAQNEGTSAKIIERATGYDAKGVSERIKAYLALMGKLHDAGVAELPTFSITID